MEQTQFRTCPKCGSGEREWEEGGASLDRGCLVRKVSWLTVFTIGLVAFVSATRGDEAEDRAVQLVEKHGGTVERDADAPGKPVVAVNLRLTKVGDGILKDLVGLKNLRELDLVGANITPAGLKQLTALKHLDLLYLSQLDVTDQALQSLRQAGLLHVLAGATTLPDRSRPKTPEQVGHMNLAVTWVSDAGLEHLAPLKNLRWLDLSGCHQVGDPGLKSLAALPNLGGLNLNGTAVGDAGLKHLAAVKTLGQVQLIKTRVTDAGVRELQKALPGCEIAR
jgi:internalin A